MKSFRALQANNSWLISYDCAPLLFIDEDGDVIIHPRADFRLEEDLKIFLNSEGIYYNSFKIPHH